MTMEPCPWRPRQQDSTQGKKSPAFDNGDDARPRRATVFQMPVLDLPRGSDVRNLAETKAAAAGIGVGAGGGVEEHSSKSIDAQASSYPLKANNTAASHSVPLITATADSSASPKGEKTQTLQSGRAATEAVNDTTQQRPVDSRSQTYRDQSEKDNETPGREYGEDH
jgi:hypothetical protein